jgi:transcription-repair coupling factor (superfamily II helicase)
MPLIPTGVYYMLALTNCLQNDEEFLKLIYKLKEGGSPALISRAWRDKQGSCRGFAVFESPKTPSVCLCGRAGSAAVPKDLSALSGKRVTTLFSREFTFFPAETVSRQLEQQRITALFAMATGKAHLMSQRRTRLCSARYRKISCFKPLSC